MKTIMKSSNRKAFILIVRNDWGLICEFNKNFSKSTDPPHLLTCWNKKSRAKNGKKWKTISNLEKRGIIYRPIIDRLFFDLDLLKSMTDQIKMTEGGVGVVLVVSSNSEDEERVKKISEKFGLEMAGCQTA